MGQAAVDLPESPEQAPAPLSSADDLLSQLAGQEIDRLLAEADANPEDEKQTAQDSPTGNATQNDIEALLNAVEKEEKLSLTPASAPAANADPYAAQMDELMKELSSGPVETPPPAPVDPVPAAAAAPAPAPAVAPATPVAPVAPVVAKAPAAVAAPPAPAKAEPPPAPVKQEPIAKADLQTSVAERAALTAPVELLPGNQDQAPEFAGNRVPLYVRILELINAPFHACPDMLRETLGKIAILTLMNSIGVLLYLLLFKR